MPDRLNRLTFLWRGAQYQENLLQAYRGFHFILQTFLLAIGAGLAAIVILTENLQKAWTIYMLLVIVTVFAVRLLQIMRRLIVARRDDVNYFHHHLLEAEKELTGDEQVLTRFKTYQKFHKSNSSSQPKFSGEPVSRSGPEQLLEKGKGHTRQLLDTTVSVYFLTVWGLFHAVVALSVMI